MLKSFDKESTQFFPGMSGLELQLRESSEHFVMKHHWEQIYIVAHDCSYDVEDGSLIHKYKKKGHQLCFDTLEIWLIEVSVMSYFCDIIYKGVTWMLVYIKRWSLDLLLAIF